MQRKFEYMLPCLHCKQGREDLRWDCAKRAQSLLLGFILRDKIGHQSQKKSEFIFHEFFDSTMSYLLLSFADAKYAMDKEIVLTQNSVANAVRSCSSC